jgi:hypothetical protein
MVLLYAPAGLVATLYAARAASVDEGRAVNLCECHFSFAVIRMNYFYTLARGEA